MKYTGSIHIVFDINQFMNESDFQKVMDEFKKRVGLSATKSSYSGYPSYEELKIWFNADSPPDSYLKIRCKMYTNLYPNGMQNKCEWEFDGLLTGKEREFDFCKNQAIYASNILNDLNSNKETTMTPKVLKIPSNMPLNESTYNEIIRVFLNIIGKPSLKTMSFDAFDELKNDIDSINVVEWFMFCNGNTLHISNDAPKSMGIIEFYDCSEIIAMIIDIPDNELSIAESNSKHDPELNIKNVLLELQEFAASANLDISIFADGIHVLNGETDKQGDITIDQLLEWKRAWELIQGLNKDFF